MGITGQFYLLYNHRSNAYIVYLQLVDGTVECFFVLYCYYEFNLLKLDLLSSLCCFKPAEAFLHVNYYLSKYDMSRFIHPRNF